MAGASLRFVTVPAVARHTATVIFLHGLGDTGLGWKPVADMFQEDPALAHVKWILPHSPSRPVAVNMGIVMPAWFDIYSFDPDTQQDEQGMQTSASQITDLIKKEVETNGIDPSRIILGGFSQGAAMALLTGLTGQNKLAALVALSGRLPLRNKFKEMAVQNALSTPIFWGTGSEDPLVKVEFVNKCVEILVDVVGVPVAKAGVFGGLTYKVYEGLTHSTLDEELEDVRTFIKAAIPANKAVKK